MSILPLCGLTLALFSGFTSELSFLLKLWRIHFIGDMEIHG